MTLCRLLLMWPSVLDVLENIFNDGSSDDNCGVSLSLISKMESYEFVFILHLMKTLLGMTNVLSQALQRKDQDIIGAVNLIESVQSDLQKYRETGWEGLLEEVNTFCEDNMIPLINMDDIMPSVGHSRRKCRQDRVTNSHHYRVEIFCQVCFQ